MKEYLRLNPSDNVAVALLPIAAGKKICINDNSICIREPIPQGHKFALCDLHKDAPVIKYGSSIGTALRDIPAGSWVHTHNLKTGLGSVCSYQYHKKETALSPTEDRTFMGFRRPDGSVGIRNEIWIIPTVGCINKVASSIEQQSLRFQTGTVEKVCAFQHPYGCSQMGDDQENTRTILADLIRHPNAGGILVLGLGCENSNINVLKNYIGDYDPNRVKFLVCQECENEILSALKLIKELADYVGSFQRECISCSELIVGMKCGGSDGLSGITANPVVGAFSDCLISKGGTTILTEVPEMFGAEKFLMDRCESEALFEKTVSLINDFKDYFTSHGQTIYENPSPGNKQGGISTLEDKSLGCTQKSGSAPIRGVLAYGEPVNTKGLNLLSAPGNDLVASTALAASGAQLILFTTGRGTPFASPVPTVKISSNTALFQQKRNWIDFNCGILTEEMTIDTLTDTFFDYIMQVASGKPVKSEIAGYHDLAIFKQGVTL